MFADDHRCGWQPNDRSAYGDAAAEGYQRMISSQAGFESLALRQPVYRRLRACGGDDRRKVVLPDILETEVTTAARVRNR
jgi:hypothetical protein